MRDQARNDIYLFRKKVIVGKPFENFLTGVYIYIYIYIYIYTGINNLVSKGKLLICVIKFAKLKRCALF